MSQYEEQADQYFQKLLDAWEEIGALKSKIELMEKELERKMLEEYHD